MSLHKEILTKEQVKLLPLIKEFSKEFVLVGGTAIALQIGHRNSIDFDLFSCGDFDNKKIKRKILLYTKINKTYIDEPGEYTIMINGVKITFFDYPYKIKAPLRLDKIVRLPNLLTLAAMKAFALGRRAKWKDYVDLYFILKNYFSIKDISQKASQIFGNEFNERIFREALAYFKDVNYIEKIIFLSGFKIIDETIKKELVEFSLK